MNPAHTPGADTATASKILYLHGFNSSPQSVKARQTQAFLSEHGASARFYCPALPYSPHAAAKIIAEVIHSFGDTPFTMIGSSLGGFYASWAAEKFNARAVLVNPAVRPWTHPALLGPQRNMYSGEEYVLTQAHLEELKELAPINLTPERYWLLLETGDETLDYRHAEAYYTGARQTTLQGGDHSFQAWVPMLEDVIEWACAPISPVLKRP